MPMRLPRRLLVLPAAAGLALAGLAAGPATASHSWGGYHWARTTSSFTLQLGDNVSGPWDAVLQTTSSDWTSSTVLDTTIVAGSTTPKRCTPTAGTVQVCNEFYGQRGWLGIATVWTSGGHITQGTVKLNDTYYSSPTYNTTAWRNLVSCQEVGHTLGLAHQDENFNNANLGSCMDYTNDPSSNQHPNTHDYAMLQSIYGHTDTATTVKPSATGAAASAAGAGNGEGEWGRAVRYDGAGRPSLYERDLGNDERMFTFVVWAA